jgi:UrcA family protein
LSNRTSLVLAVVITMTASVAASGSARAWPHDGRERVVTQVRIPLGDLDLTREAGAGTLLKRIRVAAARACGPVVIGGVAVAEEARAQRACRDQAVSRAVAQVDAPVVQALYAASKPPKPVTVAQARP